VKPDRFSRGKSSPDMGGAIGVRTFIEGRPVCRRLADADPMGCALAAIIT
jgi:hypothetical protein